MVTVYVPQWGPGSDRVRLESMCEPDLRCSAVLTLHPYLRWVGYREWPSALRYLQDTL